MTSPPTLRHLAERQKQVQATPHEFTVDEIVDAEVEYGRATEPDKVLALLDERDALQADLKTATEVAISLGEIVREGHAKFDRLKAERDAHAQQIATLEGQLDAAEQHVKIAREFGEQAAARYNELLAESKEVTCAFIHPKRRTGTMPVKSESRRKYYLGRCVAALRAISNDVRADQFDRQLAYAMETAIKWANRGVASADVARQAKLLAAILRADVTKTVHIAAEKLAYSRIPSPLQWRPIETHDGSQYVNVLLADAAKSAVWEGYLDDAGQWYERNIDCTDSHGSADYPTHWMPLPSPPEMP